MQTSEIRSSYLDFFGDRGHRIVPSSPLIPHDDPSVLFTVAGMVQFKDALLGHEQRDYSRAVSCQRCLRAGGKHNDLENVGFTARHLTFFEMLGNFSFGDYFKEEAIEWAWTYVRKVLQFEKDRLWITVHPTDDDARQIWTRKLGVTSDRVIDHPDNFWTMGDTGPCGPCSEIFYDQGDKFAGGPPGTKNEDGDRFLEFWNLVFPQFDRSADGELAPLATPGVDTGMGLERVTALKQNVQSNYQIDIFRPIFEKLAELSGNRNLGEVQTQPSFRVIADHIRASAFLISDGILPSREGRGYVLRRIIRRAIRHGYKQDLPNQFFHQLAEPLVDTIGGAYPQLAVASEQIIRALKKEEEQFSTTLQNGMNLLSNELKHVDMGTLPGDVVFKLYDTYGFPVDLTLDICQEHKVGIDEAGYEQLMSQQRAQSRAGERFQEKDLVLALEGTESIFEGYTQLEVSAEVNDIYLNEEGELKATPELTKGQRGALILNQTSFYGEAGGQVGDVGEIRSDDSTFVVTDTKLVNRLILHYGYVEEGIFGRSDKVLAKVDAVKRQDAARNHSATHLLHAALKKVLGGHVQQRGSLVEPDRLRFDFSHDLPLSNSEIEEIESLVNEKISQNSAVCTDVMPYDQAIDEGAVALFGEKYGDHVRVLEMGRGFSRELCGGTHVSSTAEIGLFRVISHSGVAAGTRRIEAVTGRQANLWTKDHENLLVKVNDSLQTNNDGLLDKVKGLLEERNKLERELRAQSARSAGDQAGILIQEAEQLGSVNLISGSVEGGSKSMMTVYDNIKSRIESGVVLLATVDKDKVNLVCGVTKDLVGVVKANDLMKKVAPIVGARGGGKPEMSRAGGGTTVTGINQFFDSAKSEIATLSQVAS